MFNTHIPVWQVWGIQCRRWPAKLLTWSEGPLAHQACGITQINIFIATLSHNLATLTTVTLHYNPLDLCLVFYTWWGLCAGSSINDGDQKLPAMWVPEDTVVSKGSNNGIWMTKKNLAVLCLVCRTPWATSRGKVYTVLATLTLVHCIFAHFSLWRSFVHSKC